MADEELVLRCISCDEPISGSNHVCDKKRDAGRKSANTRASDDLYIGKRPPTWGERLNTGFDMLSFKEDDEQDEDY